METTTETIDTQSTETAEKKPTIEEPKTLNKRAIVNIKIAKAKQQAQEAEDEIQVCVNNIQEDLQKFETFEEEELTPILERSRQLFEKIALKSSVSDKPLAINLDLQKPLEDKIEIKELSSGRVGALTLSLIAGAGTLVGWYLLGATQASLPPIPKALPTIETFQTIATSIASFLGFGERIEMGLSVAAASTLLIMGLVYFATTMVKAKNNLIKAEEIEEEVGFYCTKKEECKEKMAKIREHLKTLDNVARTYRLIIAEKNAGIERALFVEKAETLEKLHPKSQESARETDLLIKELKQLLSTPMAQSGTLTKESIKALEASESSINHVIGKLYL